MLPDVATSRSRATTRRSLERRRLGRCVALAAQGAWRGARRRRELLHRGNWRWFDRERWHGGRGDELSGVAALAQAVLLVAGVMPRALTFRRHRAATTAVFHPAGAGRGKHRLRQHEPQHHERGQRAPYPTLKLPEDRLHEPTLATLEPGVKCGIAPHAPSLQRRGARPEDSPTHSRLCTGGHRRRGWRCSARWASPLNAAHAVLHSCGCIDGQR